MRLILKVLRLLHLRHNAHDGVSNQQPHNCLFHYLFRPIRSKKTCKLRVTALCAGNSPVTGEFPAQRANNEKNVSIWWRHHVVSISKKTVCVYHNQTWHVPYQEMRSMQYSPELPSFRTFPVNPADMIFPIRAFMTFPYYIIQLYAVNVILVGLSPFGPYRRIFAINCSYSALAGSSDH